MSGSLISGRNPRVKAAATVPPTLGRISKFERGRRAETLRVYGHFITKPKVWLVPAQANGLGSLCGICISAESALHRHAEDDDVEDDLTERFWHAAIILTRPSACCRWVPTMNPGRWPGLV